ncbi:hypothetical protein SAMN05444392_102485 [Seinonella peptonophila]|uniref:Uncharacterized protein n=1 Tax=Seinonella peptonophila TaxID=112248 RepID=A0A1M4VR85_9BACL|nr:hypothetical protein [Seinonella peptonophila]SHE71385.1 hypothetical protein SAMN05444392_102485 [Seinonella peptonophila]
MKKWVRFLIGCLISFALFVLFFFAQRYNYAEPDQVYFFGTKGGYFIIALFLTVVTFFLFSFIKHRRNHIRLRRNFIIFSIFYLLCGMLVILSFDNYLLVSKKGLSYNSFFSVEKTDVRAWREIDQAVIDCKVMRFPHKKPRISFSFLVNFRNGPVIDLNSPNSPLFKAEEFQSIYNAMRQHQVPIYVKKPFPTDLEKEYPFYANMCGKQVMEDE